MFSLTFLSLSAPAKLIWILLCLDQGLCICCSFDHTSIWHFPSSTSILVSCHFWVNPVLTLLSPCTSLHFRLSLFSRFVHVFSAPSLSDMFPLFLYILFHHWEACSMKMRNSVCFPLRCSVFWEVTAWRT